MNINSTPKEYMSLANTAPSPDSTSGAMYPLVPALIEDDALISSSPGKDLLSLENSKSDSTALPSSWIRTFDGLIPCMLLEM